MEDKSPTSRLKKNKTKIIPTKGPWKKNEDDYLRNLVLEYGPKNWSYIATKMNDQGIKRLGKQCRERWYNHLSPEVRKDPWTDEEDKIIIDAHNKFGSKWTAISSLLKGRTPNAIKNRWNSTLKRVLLTGGIVKKKRKSADDKSLVEKLPEEIQPGILTIKRRRSNNDIYSGNNECLSDMLNDSVDMWHSDSSSYYYPIIPPMDEYYIPNNFFSHSNNNLSLAMDSRISEELAHEGHSNYESTRHEASPHLLREIHEFWNPSTLESDRESTNIHSIWSDEYRDLPHHESQMNWIV
jgi:hypothetical protein